MTTAIIRRVRLDSPARIRREASRVYAEARAGRLDAATASGLASVLVIIGQLADLERRPGALEKATGQ